MIDFSEVPILDSTAATTIAGFARKARRRGAAVFVAGVRPSIRRMLLTYGVRPPEVHFKPAIPEAVLAARRLVGEAV